MFQVRVVESLTRGEKALQPKLETTFLNLQEGVAGMVWLFGIDARDNTARQEALFVTERVNDSHLQVTVSEVLTENADGQRS